MSNTRPNLFMPDQQTPSSAPHNASTHPPSALVVSQTQVDTMPLSGFEALLSVTQQAYEDIFDETLASQTPTIPLPTQPIIPVATQHSPIHTPMTRTNLFSHHDNQKRSFVCDSSKKQFAKKQKARNYPYFYVELSTGAAYSNKD